VNSGEVLIHCLILSPMIGLGPVSRYKKIITQRVKQWFNSEDCIDACKTDI
jgi:hypothetical protein